MTDMVLDLMKARLSALLRDVGDKLEYAYSRWQDERGYEDIHDYEVLYKKPVADAGFTYLTITTRPFGFVFQGDDGKVYRAYCNSKEVGIVPLDK